MGEFLISTYRKCHIFFVAVIKSQDSKNPDFWPLTLDRAKLVRHLGLVYIWSQSKIAKENFS